MLQNHNHRWVLLVIVNVVALCVLGFYQALPAAPQEPRQPFANAVGQRGEMVKQLQTIAALLKEQNTLLRSGKVTVIVATPDE